MSVRIATVSDLYELRRQRLLDAVTIECGAIKRAGSLRYALKYALWAVRPGGIVDIVDDGPPGYDVRPFQIPFSVVTQQAFKLYDGDAICEDIDSAAMRLRFRRIRPLPRTGWSAGIVFSGNANEVPAIRACLDTLYRQPELARKNAGEVIVAGPAAASDVLDTHCDATYLAFENSEGPRAFTAAKKNAIIAASTQPNVAIMHGRILLQDGCLSRIGDEFDVTTPRITYREVDRHLPYIDWLTLPVVSGDQPPTRLGSGTLYHRDRYLDQLRDGGMPYIDGGLFIAKRDVLDKVPLNPALAWGEAEDVEWCSRLFVEGFLMDLDPSAWAVSQTYKLGSALRRYPRLARATAPFRRQTKQWLSVARHHLGV